MNRKKILRYMFALYMMFLVMVVILKFNGSFADLSERIDTVRRNQDVGYWNLNLIPGATIRLYMNQIGESYARENLAANVLAFVPLGFFLPACFPGMRRVWRTSAAALYFLVTVELFQLDTMLGSCDVDDIILNMIGVLIGFALWHGIKKLSDRE